MSTSDKLAAVSLTFMKYDPPKIFLKAGHIHWDPAGVLGEVDHVRHFRGVIKDPDVLAVGLHEIKDLSRIMSASLKKCIFT